MEEEEIDLDTGIRRIIRQEEPPPPPRNTNKMQDGRTRLRQGVSPFLPPPVVRAMSTLDPLLEPYVGPEASITLLTSLLVCVVLVPLLQSLVGTTTGSTSKAYDDEEDDLKDMAMTAEDYGDTVILCGPMWAGKTRILYHLCHSKASMPTVMSLRANAALLPTSTKEEDNQKPLRVLDYPGHSGLQDELFRELIQSSQQNSLRLILVVDSTQPLTTAADFLYDLLQYAHDNASSKPWPILVACHKSDLSSSKNPRRIKISLRTELEKLLQVQQMAEAAANNDNDENNNNNKWWKPGTELDLDQLENVKLKFVATTCNVGDGIDPIVAFCKHGTME
ncbi:signal recognition particle receptor subunit beta [Seminavis robusta]|uniref:Signal recognition particle receptor subunit beta n=1 Tax=Seminavis robusta TaxID=568900 RepID=A0A9N8ERG2_9STRA|nr:signal recognition particle receptor subunit beta [Seminavis robusta]|eukprot:Sro1499_g277790.1 signal recognition particle receptor subunit beta (335) ;mRNA; f:23101-24105